MGLAGDGVDVRVDVPDRQWCTWTPGPAPELGRLRLERRANARVGPLAPAGYLVFDARTGAGRTGLIAVAEACLAGGALGFTLAALGRPFVKRPVYLGRPSA